MTVYALNGLGRMGKLVLKPLLEAGSNLNIAASMLEPEYKTSAAQIMGTTLRSAVGLHRSLMASIPIDMKWWNDEE